MRFFEDIVGGLFKGGAALFKKPDYKKLEPMNIDPSLRSASTGIPSNPVKDVGASAAHAIDNAGIVGWGVGQDIVNYYRGVYNSAKTESRDIRVEQRHNRMNNNKKINNSNLPEETKTMLKGLNKADASINTAVDQTSHAVGQVVGETTHAAGRVVGTTAHVLNDAIVKPALEDAGKLALIGAGVAGKTGWEATKIVGKAGTTAAVATGKAVGTVAGHGAVHLGETAIDSAKFIWNTRNSRTAQGLTGVFAASVLYPEAQRRGAETAEYTAKLANMSVSQDNGGLLLYNKRNVDLPENMSSETGFTQHDRMFNDLGASGDLVFALHNLRNGG